MAWIIQNDELTNTDFLSTPDKPFRGDSPYTFWRVDENVNDGMPFVPLMIGLPAIAQTGAFKDDAELEKVTIPKSCASIGKFAFSGTQLKKVTIPKSCTYAATSFPEDCEISFYGGGYGQLLDGEGYPVVDGEGARIYIEE